MPDNQQQQPPPTQQTYNYYSGYQIDPLTAMIMAPLLPLLIMMNAVQSMTMPMMGRSLLSPVNNTNAYYPEAPRTKVTSITRNGNTLDIIEKYI